MSDLIEDIALSNNYGDQNRHARGPAHIFPNHNCAKLVPSLYIHCTFIVPSLYLCCTSFGSFIWALAWNMAKKFVSGLYSKMVDKSQISDAGSQFCLKSFQIGDTFPNLATLKSLPKWKPVFGAKKNEKENSRLKFYFSILKNCFSNIANVMWNLFETNNHFDFF